MRKNWVKKSSVLAIIMLFIGSGVVPCISGSLVKNKNLTQNKTLVSEWRYPPDIIVPDDYDTIQQAINNASVGDCIGVRNGTYTEQISFNKNDLILEGDLAGKTIIRNENNTNNSIMIRSDHITVTDFDFIFNASNSDTPDNYIIKINGDNCRIINNNISGYRDGSYFLTGIYAYESDYITIHGNKISTLMYDDEIRIQGIELLHCGAMYNISFNKIYHCSIGILLLACLNTGIVDWDFAGIINNKITENFQGIQLDASIGVTIKQNEISNNSKGINSNIRSILFISYNNIINNEQLLIFSSGNIAVVEYNNIVNDSADKSIIILFVNLIIAPRNYWGDLTGSPRNKCFPFFALILFYPWRSIPVPIEQTWPD